MTEHASAASLLRRRRRSTLPRGKSRRRLE
jgi:hypothetical protein